MKIFRPPLELIEKYINVTSIREDIHIPLKDDSEWNKDHRQFVLRVLLPSIRPPLAVWRITAEAYLTDIVIESTQKTFTFEQILSDGSTASPDTVYRWGNIKDPWAVGHDYLYILHKFRMPDSYNKHWGLAETHKMYRDGWKATGKHLSAYIRWLGLHAGGWVLWNKIITSKIPEPITCIHERGIMESKFPEDITVL